VHVSPRPSDSGGARIERGFGRKWVSIRERNREKFDLPTVFSILIYTHPETGFPLAIKPGFPRRSATAPTTR
jgi:ornithine cyclodeaminase/alanine dehydrogenase-like protein (mu-crystallin family)